MANNSFPDDFPKVGSIVRVTFPDGLVTETIVRQRSIVPKGQVEIHLWGKALGGYDRKLIFRENTWFASYTDDTMTDAPTVVSELVVID